MREKKEANSSQQGKEKKKCRTGGFFKIVLGLIALIPVAVFSIIVACNFAITNVTSDKIYDTLSDIPSRDICVVLGTTPYLKGNKNGNPYFYNRIEAATELYKAGKVKTIVVSGDSSKNYDETKIMRSALVKRGVPRKAIITDTKGKGTFESIQQMKKNFNEKEFTIVSQSFQNERAIFIANHYGLDAIGYNARDINIKKGYRVYFREVFARVKVFADILKSKI